MAEKQITDRSTAAEVAEAANQLSSAQRELQQWIDQKRTDPTTPREIFEGVDYGPMISAADITAQSRIIARKYDYVDYGQLSQAARSNSINSINLGGEQFFVNGLGTNPNDLGPFTPPKTSLNPNDDFAIPRPIGTTSIPPGTTTGAASTSYPPTNINTRFPPAGANDPRITAGATGRDSLANSNGIVTADSGLGEGTSPTNRGTIGTPAGNNNSVTQNNAVTDDAGGTGGTGVDSGFGPDNDPSDSEETVTRPDEGGGGTNPSPGKSVDVSQLAKPRFGGNGKAVEDNKPGVVLRPNVLHNYVNWTYSLGLYMLTPETHASIVRNGFITNPRTELANLLIKSGGTGGRGVMGDKKDYYIENLRFVSIVGQNSRTTKSSNNFDISFEIVEPYGVALLAELIQFANLVGVEDHFEIPYLLEIKFIGFNENGQPVANIPGSGPKYIPIKIINIQFKITSSATIYTVTAVPFAHSPLQDLNDAIIQESTNIKGQTFEELITSLFEYMNNAEISKAEKQQREPDTFDFKIHDEDLRTSKVGFEHVTDGNVVSVDKTTMDTNSAEYVQISSGTTLKSAIQQIVAATDFGAKYNTTGQPESNESNENAPFRLLKVMPVVAELKKYNTSTKKYARSIIYRIDTQKRYGNITEGIPRAKPTERGWQKEYNWIFTGKNQDILDFSAEYNVQYFNIVNNPYRDEKSNVIGAPSAPGNPLPNDGKTRTGAGRSDRDQQGGATYSPAITSRSSPASGQASSFRGAAHQLASDHMDNILNNPGADMLVVDLSILGDPDWIPQDRSILPKFDLPSGNTSTINGSIAVDSHDVFAMLKFKTPRDYDPEKGLVQIDTEKTFVQGLYRVIQLTSTFSDGKFEQALKMVRVQNQISNDNNAETDLVESAVETLAAGRADRDQQGSRVVVSAPSADEATETTPATNTNELTEEEQRDVDAFGSLADANSFRTRENSLTSYYNPYYTRADPFTGQR